jgi:predicted DCC family thiol-disulfide oxidoreductase YuxK
MKLDRHVAAPPPKPLMVFDGDCHFCTLWIRRWQQVTGDRVEYLPLQDARVAEQFPEIPRAQFETAVHLIAPGGGVCFGAEAVFRALATDPAKGRLLRWYLRSTWFAALTEGAYRLVAEHRPLFSWLTRVGWGKHVEAPSYRRVRWVFLRALGLVYLVAFVSLWTQIHGLLGDNGVLPVGPFISAARQFCDNNGLGADRFRLLPTFAWWNASDRALSVQCAAGVVLAGLLVAGIAPAPCLLLLWLIYLSLATAGRDFLSFQWDNLLLEAGFLAVFLAPLQLRPRPSRAPPPSRLVLGLLRWLLFRLMFESGVVKLASGDPTWRNLSALTFHYETQPLPTWLGWYAHQLPVWFQKGSCLGMFAIELAVPFLIFAPRRLRLLGAGALAGLQVLILLTGNYTFFNWLTLALCLLLLDDTALEHLLPRRLRAAPPAAAAGTTGRPPRAWPRAVTIGLAVVILPVSVWQLCGTLGWRPAGLRPVAAVAGWLAPFRSVNHYGLFAVMTTRRPEIILEGSDDGVTWRPYEFKYKPGDVKRRPAFIAPHQPRLDWQMWFAALGSYRENPWFVNLCVRLLQGSPEVLALLRTNPFPEAPPRFIRAELYDYHFTNFTERRQTGAWWSRRREREYLPSFSLPRDGPPAGATGPAATPDAAAEPGLSRRGYFNSAASCSPKAAASRMGRFPKVRRAGPSRKDTARIWMFSPTISA